MIEQVIFYIFSVLLLTFAAMVITVRNTVLAALFLILSFFSSAVIWLLLEAEFLAITLVLVYVGAVMVLFMFVVMMLDINIAVLRAGFVRYLPLGITIAVLMALAMIVAISSPNPSDMLNSVVQRHEAGYSNTAELGKALYSEHLYPFEIAGVILLIAIIAAIALTLRAPRSNKNQKADIQLAAKSADRLRIVKMASSKAPSSQDSGTDKQDNQGAT